MPLPGAEVSAARGSPSAPVLRPRLARAIAWTTVAFILAMVAARWDSRTGLTSLLRFGTEYRDRQLPAIAALPVAIKPNRGYDGQFYAQMAVLPVATDPALKAAMDNPGYRMRRMLLPMIGHVLGGGDAWRTLHAYALLNVVAWLITCWLLWRIIGPHDLPGIAVWLGCVLGLGVLDSVRMSLTDLPALVLTLSAVLIAQRARPRMAAGLLAITALVRETAIFSVPGLETRPWNDPSSWRAHLRNALITALPAGLWAAWLYGRVSDVDPLGRQNFDWPLFAIIEHASTWGRALLAGDFDSRHVFGVLAIVSFSWQSVAILRQWRSRSPWVRSALSFALLYWILGDAVWHGYWAVARACLPMTIAYNLTLPRDRSFTWRWLLGNICAFHAVYRFLPE